ncbi:hypothetical protein ABID30_002112 [Enterococcus rotai]|uniref:Uncharacterized protein n=1 Tax=Enterococcus rotai TaxID=118060 RepID=A0A0U2VGS5_9ENTE|nr:hypothetical protein [Enterococcus rotai]ALS36699.1 hypothetical protein ATZ35_05875 [Enterococcus rotai]
MSNLTYFLEKVKKRENSFVYIDDLLQKEEVTYGEVVVVLNELAENISAEQFLECQISSETEIMVNNSEILFNLPIDTEWSIPTIESSGTLIWYPKEEEKIINIEGLSETLVAVYYIQSGEYYLTIVSKTVFDTRRVSEDVLNLIIPISEGDMVLWDSDQYIGEKRFKEIVDYLESSGYIFIVHKNIVDNMESITIKSTIDWKQKEIYSIELTKKGRGYYANNELGLEVMKFVHDISVD